MKCEQKECDYREFNGGDEFHDYYFCKKCGIGLRDDDVCYDDKFNGRSNGVYIIGNQIKELPTLSMEQIQKCKDAVEPYIRN